MSISWKTVTHCLRFNSDAGLDNAGVHTQRSAASKSDAIFRKLEKPTDACARLALSTNGSVFDVTHMRQRGRIQGEFLESFAARGARSALPPSCQVCSCHDDGTGRGHTVCRLCHNDSWLWNVSLQYTSFSSSFLN